MPAARNEGVAGAYNYALRLAAREGFAWMLTLDQDTQFTAGIFPAHAAPLRYGCTT